MEIQKGQKIFISSTAYDLIDVRAELLHAIPKWDGFQALAHEAPGFPIPFGLHSHDVCLKAVMDCDIFLLIVGGRYGGVYSGNEAKYKDKGWSITRCEADIAVNANKKFLTFVRENVWNERKSYNTHLKAGKLPEHFNNSFVDNTDIFDFLNEVNHKIRDNWIHPFDNSVQLKNHLKGRLTGETTDIYSSSHFKIYDNES